MAGPTSGIDPPMKAGKPDYRTWALGLFLPKLRQTTDGVRLAHLLGDNEAHLAEARRVLADDDLRAVWPA